MEQYGRQCLQYRVIAMKEINYRNIQGSVSTRKQWNAGNRHKRSRNRAFRTGIIVFLLLLILILITFCVILFIRVNKQNDTGGNAVTLPPVSGNPVDAGEQPSGDESEDYTVSKEPVDKLPSEQEVLEEGHKVVYLTFDDGPSDNTEKLLDILQQYRIKATFFTVGKDGYDDVYRRIVGDGHTLGMHSYSHDYSKVYSSVEAFSRDFEKIYNHIERITGVSPTLYRFPGGSSNTVSNVPMEKFIKYLNDRNITYYDWNALSGDAEGKEFPADEMIDRVLKGVDKYDVSVVLLHDTNALDVTVEMLPELIEELRKLGADMLPITRTSSVIQHIDAGSVK